MSLITRIPGVTFTDNTLPKLYRDSIITPGTKWLYDAGDTYSFAKQATPTPGTDVWKSLTETPADAAFAGALAFANGGFNFTNAGTDKITLPASTKVAANARGFLSVLWINWGAQVPISGYGFIAGCLDDNSTNQWSFSTQWNADNGNLVALINGGQPNGNSSRIINIPAGTRIQIGVALVKQSNGLYDAFVFKDGAILTRQNNWAASIKQPAQANPLIGVSPATFSPDWTGRVYRAFFDDLSTTTDPLTLVAADYAANAARFE